MLKNNIIKKQLINKILYESLRDKLKEAKINFGKSNKEHKVGLASGLAGYATGVIVDIANATNPDYDYNDKFFKNRHKGILTGYVGGRLGYKGYKKLSKLKWNKNNDKKSLNK